MELSIPPTGHLPQLPQAAPTEKGAEGGGCEVVYEENPKQMMWETLPKKLLGVYKRPKCTVYYFG